MIFGFGGRSSPPVIRPLRGDKAEACARLHAAGFAHPWSAGEIERLIADPLDPLRRRARPGRAEACAALRSPGAQPTKPKS